MDNDLLKLVFLLGAFYTFNKSSFKITINDNAQNDIISTTINILFKTLTSISGGYIAVYLFNNIKSFI